jgi:DNA-binding NarL/FixJ family response regulator
MTRTDEGRDRLQGSILASVFAAMTALVAIDLITDVRAGTTAFHAALEGFVIAIGLVAAGSLAVRVRRLARDAHELRDQAAELAARLQASQQEAERWRSDSAELIAGLGAAIDQQLTRWELSPAEREIALLLLKGLSHKEIASLRDVNETTVRQQARALYRKAGLTGRSDLAAFFLEDLLGPREPPRAT